MGWWSRLFGGKTTQAQAAPESGRPDAAPAGHTDLDQRAALALRADSPEFDEFIARAELDKGDNLPHGASHLANLLLVDPAHPRWRDLLDRYVRAAGPDAQALVPGHEQRQASTEALRAWIWHAQGRQDEAVSLLVDVARALRSADILHAWVLDWLEPEGGIEGLDEQVGLRVYACLMTFTGEAPQASARQLASLRRWSALLERVAPRWEATSMLLLTRAGMLRKSGRFEEALALAGTPADARDYNRVVAIGLALRANGCFVESAQAFEHGAPLESEGFTAWLEAGDSWLAAERWSEAAAAYERVLAREPGHDWAAPSAAYCRWKMAGGDPWEQPVGKSLKAGNERARELLYRDFGAIEQSRDASAGTLRQLRAQWVETPPVRERDGVARMAVNTIEAPSACLAIALELAAFGLDPLREVSYGGVPDRDPRVAVADVAWTLWRWDGMQAHPGLPAPSRDVASEIAGLARQRYDPWQNWAQASHVAARLGAGATAQVLATMVHPPQGPAGTPALTWLPRVQLAAAMVAAQVDGGWEGSQRRAALHALLLGPSDWTTVAGIRALSWVARTEPAHAQDIHRMFEERERHLPTAGHWDWVRALYVEWQQLPWLFDREREALAAKLAALE